MDIREQLEAKVKEYKVQAQTFLMNYHRVDSARIITEEILREYYPPVLELVVESKGESDDEPVSAPGVLGDN